MTAPGVLRIAAGIFLLAFFVLRIKTYKDFPLKPGPWFMEYASDWGRHFGVKQDELNDKITSCLTEGTNGYVFCTETPEWDREWFNKRGWQFPSRWVAFSILEDYWGTPGQAVRLDV